MIHVYLVIFKHYLFRGRGYVSLSVRSRKKHAHRGSLSKLLSGAAQAMGSLDIEYERGRVRFRTEGERNNKKGD